MHNNSFTLKILLNFLALILFTVLSCGQTTGTNVNDTTTGTSLASSLTPLNSESANNSEMTSRGLSDLEAKEKQADFHDFSKSAYDLEKPDQICNLPKELLEISALGFDLDSRKLVTVNDEKADYYQLDIENCKVIDKYDFGKNDDYEGIEAVDGIVYVVKSNGDIFTINRNTTFQSQEYETPLSKDNDVEGLGYDPVRNELLLACKGAPHIDKKTKYKKSKAVYAFDLDSKMLNEEPKFLIKDEDLEKRLEDFSPSGIAKHPITGEYYILSSIGRLLIVCDEAGDIRNVHFLKPKMFAQPEGICFSPEGTMYISNEGRSLVARILVFEYDTNNKGTK